MQKSLSISSRLIFKLIFYTFENILLDAGKNHLNMLRRNNREKKIAQDAHNYIIDNQHIRKFKQNKSGKISYFFSQIVCQF